MDRLCEVARAVAEDITLIQTGHGLYPGAVLSSWDRPGGNPWNWLHGSGAFRWNEKTRPVKFLFKEPSSRYVLIRT